MLTTTVADHTRQNGALTARAEKRLLVWLAERTPGRVTPDHLTALGFAGMLLAAGSFWLARLDPRLLWLGVLGLGLNWLGDSLDGTLARVRDRQRPRYGYYIDHVCDVIGAGALLGGMALSGLMTPWVAAVLAVVYLMVSAELFLATHARGLFRMSFGRFGPTEMRILLAAGMLRVSDRPQATLAGQAWLLFDLGGVAAIVTLLAVLAVSVLRNGRALLAEEGR